ARSISEFMFVKVFCKERVRNVRISSLCSGDAPRRTGERGYRGACRFSENQQLCAEFMTQETGQPWRFAAARSQPYIIARDRIECERHTSKGRRCAPTEDGATQSVRF